MTKRKYINPEIEEIRLDNEISLQLQSPTIDPGLENYESANRINTPQESPFHEDTSDGLFTW